LHQTVNGCYAHSAIPTLAFRLATVIVQMQWHSAFSSFISDSAVRQLWPEFEYLATLD